MKAAASPSYGNNRQHHPSGGHGGVERIAGGQLKSGQKFVRPLCLVFFLW
jgi:hypothetical protein